MRLKFIVCKAIQREAYYCASQSTNAVDVLVMPQGLHNEPDKLRSIIQAEVNQIVDIQDRPYDVILLGYGLCSNGIADIKASEIPIVVARGHDCITLLLGSKERYQSYFDNHRGIYWYSVGWIENSLPPGKERYERTLQSYKEKYGEDNAEYLMQMEQNWLNEYAWATFIDGGLLNAEKYRQYTKECADYLKWNYDELKGNQSLLQNLAVGRFRSGEAVLVNLAPGPEVSYTLIITPVEMIKSPEKDSMADTIHGWFRPGKPLAEFLSHYSYLGGTHHQVLVYGNPVKEIALFGEFMGWKTVILE